MSEYKSKAQKPAAERENAAVAPVKKEILAVFMNSWKIVKSYGPAASNVHVKSFRAGELVFNEKLINEYIKQGAPLRVYVHDESASSSGIN
jgi:hypothetical protein